MKKNKLIFICLLTLISHLNTFAQVGIGTTTPRGALEINSPNSGFIPPQIALTSITTAAPVVNPQGGVSQLPLAGTIVYNTATTGSTPNNVTPGYYYWNGSKWERFSAQTSTTPPNTTQIRTILRPSDNKHTGYGIISIAMVGHFEVWNFTGLEASEAFFTLELPTNWKEGTTIYPSVNWTPLDNKDLDKEVVWHLDYIWANQRDSFNPILPVTIEGTSAVGAQYQNNECPIPTDGKGIDGIGKHANSILIGRIHRQVNDTYTGDAGALSVSFDITTN